MDNTRRPNYYRSRHQSTGPDHEIDLCQRCYAHARKMGQIVRKYRKIKEGPPGPLQPPPQADQPQGSEHASASAEVPAPAAAAQQPEGSTNGY
jgi:hypothetical protein